MSTDLIDQLDAYGLWLEAHCAAVLRSPAPALAPDNDIEIRDVAESEVQSHSSGPTGRRLMLAAAVVVLVATAAVALWSHRSTPTGPAGLPADPNGALFVLPTGDDLVLSDGTLWAVAPGSVLTGVVNAMIVGRPDGDGFVGIVGITESADRPSSPPDSWTEIHTAAGTALVNTGALPRITIQQRGDRWIRLTNVADEPTIGELLQSITLTADGISFEPVDGFVEVDTFTGNPSTQPNTVFSAALADSTATFTVSTGTASSPLFAALLAEGLDPVTINGRDGWLVSMKSDGGSLHALAWQVTPNRIVGVSGNATDQQLVDFAQRLQIVDEAAWTRALPGYTRESP